MAARISTRSGACCTRCGNSDIYKMRPGGAEPIQLTTDPAGDYAPSWSPDGRAIVFHSFRHGNRDVFTMSDDGADGRHGGRVREH
jgi:TolB protein